MKSTVTLPKKELWTLIWEDENLPKRKRLADVLRSFLKAPSAPESSAGALKVAVVIGHNSRAPGAYCPAPISMSEYQFNGLVAAEMAQRAESDPNIAIKVFRRQPFSSYRAQIKECYGRVNAWKPDIVLELHFNWLNGAGRVEMICHPSSKKGEAIAQDLLLETGKLIPGSRKLLKRGPNDRGGLSLSSAKAPAVMTEPFDCSNSEHRKIIAEIGPQGIARINYSALQKIA